jgi:hypothetical protein
MSQTPSKKMLALNAVLLAVLLVSLPLQVRAYWPDWFYGAVQDWNACTSAWSACYQGCGGATSCEQNCYSTLRNCWVNIVWPEANPDSCAIAQTAYNACVDSYNICASAGISPGDCFLTRNDCELASGLYQCQ